MSENVRKSWEWTPQRERAAYAVATSKTYQEAAKTAGVSDKSIQRWMDEPVFADRVSEHTSKMVRRARQKLEARAADAADMLIDIMLFGAARHTTRLIAAKDILDRVGVKAPEKIAFTDPTGTQAYADSTLDGLRERLIARFAAESPAAEAGNVSPEFDDSGDGSSAL